MIETAARRACRTAPTRARKEACIADAIQTAVASADGAARRAVADARREREERAGDRVWAQR
jgi:hypothetical protein